MACVYVRCLFIPPDPHLELQNRISVPHVRVDNWTSFFSSLELPHHWTYLRMANRWIATSCSNCSHTFFSCWNVAIQNNQKRMFCDYNSFRPDAKRTCIKTLRKKSNQVHFSTIINSETCGNKRIIIFGIIQFK